MSWSIENEVVNPWYLDVDNISEFLDRMYHKMARHLGRPPKELQVSPLVYELYSEACARDTRVTGYDVGRGWNSIQYRGVPLIRTVGTETLRDPYHVGADELGA